jgi:hypothetical protein
MLWFINSSDPAAEIRQGLRHDPAAAASLAGALCPDLTALPIGETDLASAATPADDQLFVGVYGSLIVVTSPVLSTTTPSTLPEAWITAVPSDEVVVLHTEPESSLGAFARWEDGTLRRSFSANPVTIYENIGLPFIFEGPFWAGEHPLKYADGAQPDPQALPFHPQEFAEQAIREWLGFRFTTPLGPEDYDPSNIVVSGFAIRPKGYVPSEADVELGLSEGNGTTDHVHAPDHGPAGGERQPSSEHKPGRVARWFGFGPKS